jgi:hypothetical protein
LNVPTTLQITRTHENTIHRMYPHCLHNKKGLKEVYAMHYEAQDGQQGLLQINTEKKNFFKPFVIENRFINILVILIPVTAHGNSLLFYLHS